MVVTKFLTSKVLILFNHGLLNLRLILSRKYHIQHRRKKTRAYCNFNLDHDLYYGNWQMYGWSRPLCVWWSIYIHHISFAECKNRFFYSLFIYLDVDLHKNQIITRTGNVIPLRTFLLPLGYQLIIINWRNNIWLSLHNSY
jgi:hypothetical protein